MIRAAALAAALLALAGCEPATPEQVAARKLTNPAFGVEVIHDEARGVTCWRSDVHGGRSISCLPDWMLERPPAPEPSYPNSEPCGRNKACIGFSHRRDALACAEGRLTGPACDAWRERSRQGGAE